MFSLKTQSRDPHKEKAKGLRRRGVVPAVLYGKGIDNICLKVDRKAFEDVYQQVGESSLIGIEVLGQKEQVPALIHDIAYDPLTGNVSHIDFYHPAKHQKVEVEVPLEFVGQADAVEKEGGVLVKEIQAIELKGEPQNLPRSIEVDIGRLKTLEDKIKVKDLKVPEGVEVVREPDEIVASVTEPEELVEEEEEAETGTLTEEELAGEETTEEEGKEERKATKDK